MNYLQFVNTILDTSKSHKLVYEVGEGDIYEHLNSGDHKYPCVFLTVQNVDSNGTQMTVTGSLFYVDALLSDTSNKLQIQSTGMTTLQQIFMRLMDNNPDFDLRTGRYTPFDEKFSDLCAGVFSNFTISFMDDICIFNDDIFEGDVPTPPTPPGPEPPTPPEPTGKYMTITVDGNAGETIIKPTVTGNLPTLNLQYRVNNGEWTDFIVGTTEDIHVVAGDLVQFKGVNESGISSESNYLKFAISGNPVALSGNVMSLIDGVGDAIVVPCDYCFYRLFHSSSIKTVSPDFLPATTLSDYCYYSMFDGCTSLTQAPELPATTLVTYCYSYMFADCTSLTTAPVLPATTLDFGCYWNMFLRCTSLTQSPELPATTLAQDCYYRMFSGCTLLTTAPVLPATTLANNCYSSMFYGCSALVNAPALPATTLAKNCYSGMFGGCTSLTQAPELPAVTLHEYCYSSMFSECTSLTQAPELPATTLDLGCYLSMFEGCTSLNYVKCLSTDITATNALYNWLSGVASSGTFVKKYGVEYLIDSPSGIPQGWTVEEIDVPIPPEPEPKYMTITVDDAVGETVIKPTVTGSLPNLNLQYRINNGDWTNFIVGTTADIHLTAGNFIQFKGNNISGISVDSDNYLNFAISGNPVALSGNVMSLIDGIGDTLVIQNNYCFYKMFSTSNVKTVSSDFLHATTIAGRCYSFMFADCTALENAPELPATTLANNCYSSMFYGCKNLVQATSLPATTLADYCYSSMFNGCTSLVQSPDLHATTLSNYCYYSMFQGCTSLTTAPALPATTLTNSCYQYMFTGCTSLVNPPEISATTLADWCCSYMFLGCTSLTKAPELTATTLTNSCCWQMFKDCISLNYVKCLAKNPNRGSLWNWLENVSSTGTFVKPAGVSYESGGSGIPEGWTVEEIDVPIPPEPEPKYMTITVDDSVEGEAVIKPTVTGSLPNLNLQYRINNREWNDFIVGTTADIHLTAGDWVQFKGNNTSGISTSQNDYMHFSISGNPVSLSGNIMSLIDGVGDALEIPCNYCFFKLFSTSNVKTVSPYFLHATTIADNCYAYMFYKCTSLVTAPELPATTLARSCYSSMFQGCTSLVSAPALPATSLANNCYTAMFYECSSLTKSPKLPATTLAGYCYRFMFYKCTSLTTAPELPATNLAPYCYSYMFAGCTSLTTAPELPATMIVGHCYEDMFAGCTSLKNAPALPATTLAEYCYAEMFDKCTSLTTAPALPATTLAEWCYFAMFANCKSLTKAPELPATTLDVSCYQAMFEGCSSLVNAPELPATTLAENCYIFMFRFCSKLNYVKCLLRYTNTKSQEDWLYRVSSTGTFVKPYDVSYETGASGIPYGWTVRNI